MEKAGGFVRLIRPPNCLMMGFAVVIGAALTSLKDLSVSWLNLTFGFLTGFLLTAASMVVNDYYDLETDSTNEPKRPIPSGTIKPREALGLALALTIAGFLAAYLTSESARVLCLATAIIAWLVSVAYTTRGKRSGLMGNFLVSTCVAIPFIYGSIAMKGLVELNVLVFVLIAFLSNTGREITKGIADVQGDRLMNTRTIAVRYGERSAAIAAVLFYFSAVALSLAPWIMGLVSIWFVPFATVTDFGLIVCSLMLLKDYSRENARRVKNRLLFVLIFGLLAFFAGVYA
jgi:geranylgeranylglycerol-phosphate geranylgeranyltransferase